ncbi:hypothetical protein [Palleronia caenipelagi]|nr:hypothetical protein [Palleronia caenipelagi]
MSEQENDLSLSIGSFLRIIFWRWGCFGTGSQAGRVAGPAGAVRDMPESW